MKSYHILPVIAILLMISSVKAQVYNDIAHYAISGTPMHGIKIRTNIPFRRSADMVTVTLTGYCYGRNLPMNLQLCFYIWHENERVYFWNPSVSSSGAYTPKILLADEMGKIVIYIDDRVYYHHFHVNAFSGYFKPDYYQNWSIVDEPLTGTAIAEVSYKNAFKGHVDFQDGVWNSLGNVGIGTSSPSERLAVNGNIRAREIKVEATDWPDYVFQPKYNLRSLADTEQYITENGHLPEVPKASDVEMNGVSLGEMNKILLKKIEEMTLYIIQLAKDNEEMKMQLQNLNSRK